MIDVTHICFRCGMEWNDDDDHEMISPEGCPACWPEKEPGERSARGLTVIVGAASDDPSAH